MLRAGNGKARQRQRDCGEVDGENQAVDSRDKVRETYRKERSVRLYVKPRLHDTTRRFHNRLYRVNEHPTGLTTGWMFVYTMQPVFSCNRLYRVNGV